MIGRTAHLDKVEAVADEAEAELSQMILGEEEDLRSTHATCHANGIT